MVRELDEDPAAPETRPHWQCVVLTALPLAFAAWLVATFPAPAKSAAGPVAAVAAHGPSR